MVVQRFCRAYMESPPPAVFHYKYQSYKYERNTAGKSATSSLTFKRGELLRLVPCMLVWHHQKNIFFLQDLAKLKLKTSNIYVTMKKKHSGQAPNLLVLIWDLSQFWPCHTNMLGFFKSLLSRNFCSEICWECLKNILLDIDEFQAEEASSLLILKAIFLS